MTNNLSDLINLKKYDISAIGSKPYEALISLCHKQIDTNGLCLLPDFVKKSFYEEVIAEVRENEEKGFYNESWRSPFGNESRKAQENSIQTRASMKTFAYDLLALNSKLRLLYESDIFTEFLKKILRVDNFFKCADPLVSCLVASLKDDDELGWHYDPNDGVVTLLLQKPDKGGEFEFVPNSKESSHEVSDNELSIIDNQDEDIISLAQNPGTLAIFNGSNSLHRVAPVAGNSERIVAILSYSEVPDFIFSSKIRKNFLGRSS